MEKYKVQVEQLRKVCDCDVFPFASTADILPLEGIIGQERAVRALEFGLNINKEGYNIFIAGVTGTGRNSYAKSLVNKLAAGREKTCDWCYLYNFSNPDQPKAVSFPAGKAVEFAEDIQAVIARVKEEIPRTLEEDDHQKAKTVLLQKLQNQQNDVQNYINKTAKELGFALKSSDKGLVTIPLNGEGKPMEEDEYQSLNPEENEVIEVNSKKLNYLILDAFKNLREFELKIETEIEELENTTILQKIDLIFGNLRTKYADNAVILAHLDAIQQDLLKNSKEFKGNEQRTNLELILLKDVPTKDIFQRYQVNVLVSHEKTNGAPVICEANPTFYNLLGRIEYENQMGVLTTDFMKIKSGCLHQANGGYLLLRCKDVLINPYCWDALKRCLKTERIQMESLRDQMGLIATSSLKPEPIPLNVKIIMIGSYSEYSMLYHYDEDFRKLFKIMVDFDVEMERSEEHMYKLARFISDHCEKENIRHFTREAVGQIVEYSSRLADNQDKLSTRFNELVEIIYEADAWAEQDGVPLVTPEYVNKAIWEKTYRSNKYEKKMHEMIIKGAVLIDTESRVIGQINGLAVLDTGEYAFGKPTRITVSTYLGRRGIINIEREVKMSGAIHDKGVLILSGYLGEKFGKNCPVSFSASICFEQLYHGVDGDSASSAELYALISSLAQVPLDQGIAVTGSVNQKGFIQPIGGVNQKVEGFFQVCKAKGLTGRQGVIIPEQNVTNLMLDHEVVEAVKEGRFHIYAIKTLEEGIEILTGRSAGQMDEQGEYPYDSVFGRVQQQLMEYYRAAQKLEADR
jgi:lon-related putative ATP-dependent protease